jgi:hypothetical protein
MIVVKRALIPVMNTVGMTSVHRLVSTVGAVLVSSNRVVDDVLISGSHDSFSSSADQAERVAEGVVGILNPVSGRALAM